MLQLLIALALGLYLVYRALWRSSQGSLPLPPGPSGLPLIGSVIDLPKTHLWGFFRKLHDSYGPIWHITVAGQHMVGIGELSLARELFEKSGALINSSRPDRAFLHGTINSSGRYYGFGPNDASWKTARRVTAVAMQTTKTGGTEPLQTMEARLTIMKLLEDPERFRDHFSRFSASVLLGVTYGQVCPTGEEPEIKQIEELTDMLVILAGQSPMIMLVETLPWLLKLPGRFWPWTKTAEAYAKLEQKVFTDLMRQAVAESSANTWVYNMLTPAEIEAHRNNDGRKVLPTYADGFFVAGAETTRSTLSTFVLAAVMHPAALAPVIAQIDSVCGDERMPDFSDRENLPLVEATAREILRWRTVVPFAIPHLSSADQTVNVGGKDHLIPKGTILFGNVFTIDHDPTRYPDPDHFNPSRFLDADGKLVPDETTTFGFGRRVCPGQAFGERSIWIVVASILWALKFEKAPDPATGQEFKYSDVSEEAFTGDGLTTNPTPFPCRITPRSQKRLEVAKATWERQEKDLPTLLPLSKKE